MAPAREERQNNRSNVSHMNLRRRINQENIPSNSSLFVDSLVTPSSSQSSTSQSQNSSRENPEHTFAREEIVTHPNGKTIRRYHCKCGKTRNTRKSLLGHIQTEKTGKVFKCHLCPRCDPTRFSTHRSLKIHLRTKHLIFDNTKYGCRGCGKEFETFEKLAHHRKLEHPTIKLGKPMIGVAPPPSQPLITAFLRKN